MCQRGQTRRRTIRFVADVDNCQTPSGSRRVTFSVVDRQSQRRTTSSTRRPATAIARERIHSKSKKQLWEMASTSPLVPPLDSSNGDLLLPVCVALAGGQSYTSLNNNICLKGCKALYSAVFASLCGRKRQGYSARTPEGLRTYSARTPQVLRNYSMNPIALVVWYRSMLSHNSTHQSLRDSLLGRNFHPHPASCSARVPHEIATRHRSTEQLPSWPRCSTASV